MFQFQCTVDVLCFISSLDVIHFSAALLASFRYYNRPTRGPTCLAYTHFTSVPFVIPPSPLLPVQSTRPAGHFYVWLPAASSCSSVSQRLSAHTDRQRPLVVTSFKLVPGWSVGRSVVSQLVSRSAGPADGRSLLVSD